MKPLGKIYNETEANMGDFERLPAGGYVCKITSAKDCPLGFKAGKPDAGNYIEIIYDIAEGQYKGFYSDDWGEKHPTAHSYYASYKDSNFGRFKGFLKAIDESNNTNFEQQAVTGLDEKQLVGKLIGLVIGYEEYNTDRGEVKESAKARFACSAARIRSGDFKVPELKKLEAKAAPAADPRDGFTPFGAIDESQIPF